MNPCPFCRIVSGEVEPPVCFHDWGDVVSFEPLNPVTPGHVLVVPKVHVVDFVEDPLVTGRTFQVAAEYTAAARNVYHEMDRRLGLRPQPPVAYNLITSAGAAATQTVLHLHVHAVPRFPGDGFTLPWTGQRKEL